MIRTQALKVVETEEIAIKEKIINSMYEKIAMRSLLDASDLLASECKVNLSLECQAVACDPTFEKINEIILQAQDSNAIFLLENALKYAKAKMEVKQSKC
jgi:hypothetical protein